MPAWMGQRLVILLAHEDPAFTHGKPYVVIKPGNKFGTGAHATTRICLAILERILNEEQSVLDVGTGTGILALYAARVGARYVVAIDQDFEACETCKWNILRNTLEKTIHLFNGRANALSYGKLFDIVIANLELDILIPLIPTMRSHLKPDGLLVISGVLASSKDQFTEFLEGSSLKVLSSGTEGDWIGFLATPSHE
ncbi:MAG: 50S ribosomal protein L11 methyltransferase [Candidatus Methylomirabilales bacterium]